MTYLLLFSCVSLPVAWAVGGWPAWLLVVLSGLVAGCRGCLRGVCPGWRFVGCLSPAPGCRSPVVVSAHGCPAGGFCGRCVVGGAPWLQAVWVVAGGEGRAGVRWTLGCACLQYCVVVSVPGTNALDELLDDVSYANGWLPSDANRSDVNADGYYTEGDAQTPRRATVSSTGKDDVLTPVLTGPKGTLATNSEPVRVPWPERKYS